MRWIVRTSIAIWGLALAIGLMPRLERHASPGDLPGAMKAIGVSASSNSLQLLLIILVPAIVTLIFGRFTPVIVERRWVAWSCSIALASAPLTLMTFGNVRHVLLHGAVATAIVFLRRLDPKFTREDIVLIPTLFALYFAFLDLNFGGTIVATLLRAAIILFALRLVRPARAFAAAPLAFIFQIGFFQPRWAGILAILWILLWTAAATLPLSKLKTYVFFPLAAVAYTMALVGWNPPILDTFEDAHSLLSASEMNRGERPYRDVVPMHGLLSDGLLDVAVMKTLGDNLGAILKTRQVLGALSLLAVYFVALAATTSAELALLAVFLSLALFPFNALFLRVVPALLALACAVAGTRLRAKRWFLFAGIALVLSALTSVDFAIFSACVAVFAAIRARAVRPFAIGLGIAALPILLLFALFGILDDFFYSSLVEVLGASNVYVMSPIDIPHGLHTLGGIIAYIGDANTLAGLIWFIALIGATVVLTLSPLRAKRSDAVWLIAAWIALAGATFVVRKHYYFAFAIAPFLIGAILAARRHSRPLAIALTIAVALIAKPTTHLFDVATPLRRSHGIAASGFVEYRGTPRARGAVVNPETAKALASAQRFITTQLHPDETFYDFAGAGSLHYIFDREAPVRMIEVAMSEREETQREIVAALERNRRVRAVLILFPGGITHVDNIPNSDRAPLVWRYIHEHFRPAFHENGAEFWTR
jgi:hypothetical protein